MSSQRALEAERHFATPSTQLSHEWAPALILITAGYLVALISVGKFNLTGLFALASLPIGAIVAFRLPIKPILFRLVILSPFILMLAVANPWLDRRPFMSFGHFEITAGMVSGFAIIFRTLLSVGALLIIMRLLPFHALCSALRTFKAPQVLITQLLLLYRYAHLLMEEALALQRARHLRSFGSNGKGLRTTSYLLGSLLIRSLSRSSRVYQAMVARGFGSANGAVSTSSPKLFPALLKALPILLSLFILRILF